MTSLLLSCDNKILILSLVVYEVRGPMIRIQKGLVVQEAEFVLLVLSGHLPIKAQCRSSWLLFSKVEAFFIFISVNSFAELYLKPNLEIIILFSQPG